MPQQDQFVVRFTETSSLYLTNIIQVSEEQFTYEWGNVGDALIFNTLPEAEAQATSIGGGTVGTPKP